VGLEELLDELTIAPDDEDEHPTTEWGPSPQPAAAAPVLTRTLTLALTPTLT